MSGFWPRIACNEYEYSRGFIFSEDPRPDHLVVLIHSKTANGNGRNDRRESWK